MNNMTGDKNQPLTVTKLLIYSYVPVLLILSLIKKINSFDIWYHMVIGRKIFEDFRIPKTEFFLYPLLGEKTSFHEWGFGLLFYAMHRWFGFWGMSVLQALIGGGTLYIFYRAAEGERRNNPLAIILLCALLLLVYYRFIYRPELMLFFCLGCTIYLLEKFVSDMRWSWLLPMPFLAFFLSNFHPSVFFVLLVFVCYIVQFAADAYRNDVPQSRTLGISVLILAASFLASLINPYGLQQVILPFSYMQSEELLKSVTEYYPTLSTTLKWPFIAICSMGLLALVFQKGRRPADWLLFIFFGYLGFKYVRNVALFGLVMYVPVVRGFDQLIVRTPFFISRNGKRILWASACLAGGITAAVILQQGKWGSGPNLQRFPDKAVKVINEVEPPGRILNYYDSGGYLAWKLYDKYRVFIDGRRYEMDEITELHNAIFFKADPEWKTILAEYNVSTIITRATSRFSGQLIPLIALLYNDDDWVLSAVEPWYYLFIKRDAIEDLENVPVLDKRLIWESVLKETDAIETLFPNKAQVNFTEGIAYFKLGYWKAAKDAFKKYMQTNPSDKEVKQIIEWLEADERGDKNARKNLQLLY